MMYQEKSRVELEEELEDAEAAGDDNSAQYLMQKLAELDEEDV